MTGPRQDALAALFYAFTIEEHVTQDHLLQTIPRSLNQKRGDRFCVRDAESGFRSARLRCRL